MFTRFFKLCSISYKHLFLNVFANSLAFHRLKACLISFWTLLIWCKAVGIYRFLSTRYKLSCWTVVKLWFLLPARCFFCFCFYGVCILNNEVTKQPCFVCQYTTFSLTLARQRQFCLSAASIWRLFDIIAFVTLKCFPVYV